MKREQFTQQEFELIKYYSAKQSLMSRLTFYVCILFAPLAFAVYGLLNDDVIAVFIAACGLAALLIWLLFTSTKYETKLNRICSKILLNELDQ